ncbi:hypothetical protein Q0F99_05050 [Rathayibacter oskolensis]|uniref:hypothetical protein n=1 Tax=Rathayibacter oskolensis TaxID=1891671 RepID=UPI00265F8415|nr:hypothetical protein [Rathayibacter oskolensis]WKK72351.1 hypothetical protein Q0F99_05050 [Rathayibacter oskolensis]
MSTSRARRAARDARAAAADGTALRWPGAANKFALFAEVLFTGVLVTVLALPLVTLPLALAVGARHLRRFVLDEPSTLGAALAEARAGLLRSLPIGLGLVVASAALALDLALVAGGALPGPRPSASSARPSSPRGSSCCSRRAPPGSPTPAGCRCSRSRRPARSATSADRAQSSWPSCWPRWSPGSSRR